MIIERIRNSNSNISFKAGKVRVFSDFDKTFLPSTHKNFVCNEDSRFVNAIRENFKSFKKFLDNTREGLKFTITTGRTFGEFLTMAEIARNRKFAMPLPDTLIVKNGSDEHLRVGTDETFYNGGEFPFKYDVTNKEKEEKIKNISGWDGAKVKQILKEIFNSYNFRIVEADSEHSVTDYGSRSLFSEGKLPYEVGKTFYGTDKADWSVGLRNDGNLKVFFTLPADMFEVDERRIAYQDIQNQIIQKFSENGIKYAQSSGSSHEIHGRPSIDYSPNVGEQYQSGVLTKLYDTREAVKEATKNNDLVIVAGDSSNDAVMLNPGLYLQDYLSESILSRYDKMLLLYDLAAPRVLIKILDADPELADIFIKMPFRGIIVRQNNGKNKLEHLEQFTKGKYQKIIVVDEGELQSGIKESIKMYCEQNPKYKEKLSIDLNKEINPDYTPKGDDSGGGIPNILQYIIGAVGVSGIGIGIYLWNKNKNKDLKEHDITNNIST